MTPTEQAARWLADVRRYNRNGRHMELDPQGPWLHEAEVLAAIARHLAPVAEQDALDAAWCERVAAITADNATLRDRLARMEGPLEFPADWRERAHSFKGLLKLQAAWADGFNAARAALTDGGSNG